MCVCFLSEQKKCVVQAAKCTNTHGLGMGVTTVFTMIRVARGISFDKVALIRAKLEEFESVCVCVFVRVFGALVRSN